MNALTMNGSRYISIHENPLSMLRPTYAATRGLEVIGLIARKAVQVCQQRDDRDYYRRMADIAIDLHGHLEGAIETAVVRPMPAAARRRGWNADVDLHAAIEALEVRANGEAMRLVRAVTDGELETLLVKVDERWTPADDGGEPKVKLVRSLVGYGRTLFPANATVFFSDATAERRDVEAVLGRPVRDTTPCGVVERKHPVLQIPQDVTRRTTVGKAAAILRGILQDVPYRRVGVLTHKNLCDGGLIDALGAEYAGRVAKLDHFGGAESRGSNDWTDKCNALIVLGTPRVPPHAITDHLLRLGKDRAARRTKDDVGWGWDYWSGVTESGRRVAVRTLHYTDHDWHAAHLALVVAELKQSLGRARVILDKGIPAFLVTTEELGETVAEAAFAPVTEPQARVLAQMQNGRGVRLVCTGPEIARALGMSDGRVRQLLGELLQAGRVRHVGKKWERTAPAFPVASAERPSRPVPKEMVLQKSGLITAAEREYLLTKARQAIANAERCIADNEQMMRDGLPPLDVEPLREKLAILRIGERFLASGDESAKCQFLAGYRSHAR